MLDRNSEPMRCNVSSNQFIHAGQEFRSYQHASLIGTQILQGIMFPVTKTCMLSKSFTLSQIIQAFSVFARCKYYPQSIKDARQDLSVLQDINITCSRTMHTEQVPSSATYKILHAAQTCSLVKF